MRRSRRERGQSLLLWALMLLLISLMVIVTLGVGKRTHERMEAQVAADAAAYSNAVAVARSMNMISLLNRTQTSHMVAWLAVQSLISWSGVMKAAYGNSTAFGDLATNASGNANCTPADLTNIGTETGGLTGAGFQAKWVDLDTKAGLQSYQLQGISGVSGAQYDILNGLTGNLISGQKMTRAIAKLANPELDARTTGDGRNIAALGVISGGDGRHSIMGAMGSRGDPFPRERKIVPSLSGNPNMPHITITVTGGGQGGSGFGKGTYREESQTVQFVSGWNLWAEDHPAQVTIQYQNGACTAQAQFNTDDGWAMSSALEYTDDQHHYNGTDEDTYAINQRHTMGPCTPYCPGILPGHLDYNDAVVDNVAELFGQPVLYSIVHRDLSQRKDPWNLGFKFFFTPTGAAFDNGNPNGVMQSQPALRYQVALGTSVVYYHRPTNFQEQPNLYNPFWRATLLSMKRYRVDEAVNELNVAGFAPQADALNQLDGAGFKGYP